MYRDRHYNEVCTGSLGAQRAPQLPGGEEEHEGSGKG